MENQQKIQYANQAIILDLSLFILDILDAGKIKKKYNTTGHILEVPGALILMMRDAESGSPVLFLFIYSLLRKLSQKYTKRFATGQAITDQRLRQLVNAQEHQLTELALTASKRLFAEFLPLIEKTDINIKTASDFSLEQEKVSRTFEYPIRRHDQIAGLSPSEQVRLQEIYTRELNLPRHNLFDLYFAQVYHAQKIGFTGIRYLRERTVSLGEETFNIIYKWKWDAVPPYLYKDNHEDLVIINESREFIAHFTKTYVRENRDNIIFSAKYELPIALITGGPAGLGASIITMAGGTIRDAIKEQQFAPETEQVLLAIVSATVLLLLIALFGFQGWIFLSKFTTMPTATLTPPNPSLAFTPTLFPTTTELPIHPTNIPLTQTPIPQTSSPSPTSITVFNSNYCLYLIQSGDTAQSISAWFGISESDYRATNNSHSGTEFTAPHMVTINAPCCNSQYPNGISYTVRQGDTIYSLAKTRGFTPEYLKTANRLQSSYIQTGQMLCLP